MKCRYLGFIGSNRLFKRFVLRAVLSHEHQVKNAFYARGYVEKYSVYDHAFLNMVCMITHLYICILQKRQLICTLPHENSPVIKERVIKFLIRSVRI